MVFLGEYMRGVGWGTTWLDEGYVKVLAFVWDCGYQTHDYKQQN